MPEELTRVQRRQKETRERIFRVAMELFKYKGFENTTVAEITEAADIGKGTFFTYFPTKESVFGHLGEMLVEAMAATVTESLSSGRSVSSVLEDLFAMGARWNEDHRSLTHQVLLASTRSVFVIEADAANQRQLLELLTSLIRAGQERGEFATWFQAEDAAMVMFGAYFATLMAWAFDADTRSLPERMQSSLQLLSKGLQA